MKVDIVFDPKKVGIDFNNHVFAQPNYLAASSSIYGWFVSHNYVLPFYIDSILFFKRLIFTTAPIALFSSTNNTELLHFLDAVVALAKQDRMCDFISKPQSNAVFPVAPSKATSCDWGSYVTDINRTDEMLLKAFHSKHRNVIIKAKKDGVEISQTWDHELVQECIQQTVSRQKVPYFPSKSFVKLLCDTMPDNILMMKACYQGELQGVALVLYDNSAGYYLYGGSIPKPYSGSLNLLQYEVMLYLHSKGVSRYDFVGARLAFEPGSKYEGIQRFKSRFGAELNKGKAFRVVFSSVKFHLFNFMAKVYCQLKGWHYEDSINQIRKHSGE